MRPPGYTQQRASGHLQQAPAAFWGVLHPSLGHCTAAPDTCKTQKQGKQRKSHYTKCQRMLIILPRFQKPNYFTPTRAHPSPRHCLVHHRSHKPTWKTWRCQRLDGVISPQCQGKTALWEHRSPLPTAQARGCSAAMNKPWKHSAVLAPRQWQQLKLRRCLFVHLLCPQTNMQKVEKPWKGRELPTHFELL